MSYYAAMSSKSTAVCAPPAPIGAGFMMTRRAPGPALRQIVLDICGYRERTSGHFRQIERASLVVPFIVSLGDPFAIALGRTPGAADRQPSFAAGLFAGPVVIDSFGGSECVQVNFTPAGAKRFFGLPMHALAASMVPLDDLFGSEVQHLRERLCGEPDWQRRFDHVERFVAARLREGDAAPTPVEWAYGRLSETHGGVRIGALAAEIGWSRRRLVERFRDEIGMPPKTVARIARFNRALRLAATAGNIGWADIAADCGYADQAHLTREFALFAGVSPSAWAAHPDPFFSQAA